MSLTVPVSNTGRIRALHQKLYRLLCSCGVTKTARRGGLADFEEQVLVIAIPATPPEHRADVAVDRFHFAEGNLLVTVVQDPGQMAHQQGAELLEGRQPLPPQGEEPVGEEAIRRGLVGVGPELGELFLEQVGLGQTPVEGEQAAEGFSRSSPSRWAQRRSSSQR